MYLLRETLPSLKGYTRFLHAAPGATAIDIYANGEILSKNLAFSDISNYFELTPGNYKIQIFKSGTYDKPLLSTNYESIPNSSHTVSIILLESTLELFNLKDSSSTSPQETSFFRFINLSPTAPLLNLSLPNGNSLFTGVEYLETTGYYPLSSGIYDFVLSATGASALNKFIKEINLNPGEFSTLYIIGQLDDKPQLGSLFLVDGNKK